MEKIRILHETAGCTLTVWLDEPSREVICEETADEARGAVGRRGPDGVRIVHVRIGVRRR